MKLRYIFSILIPLIFLLSSCSTRNNSSNSVFNFSSNTEKEIDLKKDSDNISIKNKEYISEKVEPKKIIEKSVKLKQNDFVRTNSIRKYNLGYLTFDVANLYGELKAIEATNGYPRYQFKFYGDTNGTVDYLIGWQSNTVSTFRLQDNKVVPEKFRTKSKLRRKTREIVIDYDETGKTINFEKVTPADKRPKRPEVAKNLKVNTFDPLSIVVEARRKIMESIENNSFNSKGKYSFSLPLYDGRRRTDINFTLDKKLKENMYFLKVNRTAIAGFTERELKEISKGKVTINFYLDKSNFWPVRVEGSAPVGTASASFVENCNVSFDRCIVD